MGRFWSKKLIKHGLIFIAQLGYILYQIYDHVIFPAQVDALKSMDTPDPNDDKIVKYAQTLKLSHEAAMKELWGLDKVTEGPDSPKQA